MKTYIIYCDESTKQGKYYTNFYGGALVESKYFQEINDKLNQKKRELNLYGEVKWSKVSLQYLDKYKSFIEYYFSFVKDNKIKIRIMFKQKYFQTVGLTKEQQENEFYLLYYQFFKHAFGFRYCNDSKEEIYLIPYFDKLPDTTEKNEKFKTFIYNLQFLDEFKKANIKIRKEDIAEVESHKHVILQGMDVIMGAIQFRLNDEHKKIDPATGKKGNKTKAKEELYEHIRNLICNLRPDFKNFNIGNTTGKKGSWKNLWLHPYRHWKFVSKNYVIDPSKAKK